MFSNKYQNEYKIAESFHIKEMDGKIPQKNTTQNIMQNRKNIVKRLFCLCSSFYAFIYISSLFRNDESFGQNIIQSQLIILCNIK